jgi:predicted O-methyltransferase YrrM
MYNKILNRIKAIYLGLLSRGVLIMMCLSLDKTMRKVAFAVLGLKRINNFSEDEKQLLNKAEKIRSQYLSMEEYIDIVDFGAGDPEKILSAHQIKQGVNRKVSVSEVCQKASLPVKWGRLIFKLIRKNKPENCLELGTCLGISASYQLAALELNHKGKLTTIEGSTELLKLVRKKLSFEEHRNLVLIQGKFIDVLPELISSSENQFDFVFIDGHHEKNATLQYFDLLFPSLKPGSIIIFDDINWSAGMKEAWEILKQDERIKYTVDLYKWGICITNNKGASKKVKRNFIVPF